MTRSRTASLLAFAALIAGCGGSSSPSGDASSTAPKTSTSIAQSAPNGGPLRVGITDAGIGAAVTGSSGGLETLPNTPVPGDSNTATGVGAGASCPDTDVLPAADNLDVVQASTLCLLNGERADKGLRPLRENGLLAEAAERQSEAMVSGQFFDHVGKDGSDPVSRIREAGYIPSVGTWTVGENLAWGTGSLSTPKAIVAAWMKSQGHRENILRSTYKEIGFGVVAGNPESKGDSGATFTTTFGAVKTPKVRRARAAKARSAKARSAKLTAKASSPRGG